MKRILLTNDLRRRLRNELDRTPVLFAYLFGSRVTGRADAESDADIAVYLDPQLARDERFDAQLLLYDAFARSLKLPFKRIDVSQLNEASLLLRYVAMAEGTILYERDHGSRVTFELSVLQERDDTHSFRCDYRAALVRRILARAP